MCSSDLSESSLSTTSNEGDPTPPTDDDGSGGDAQRVRAVATALVLGRADGPVRNPNAYAAAGLRALDVTEWDTIRHVAAEMPHRTPQFVAQCLQARGGHL